MTLARGSGPRHRRHRLGAALRDARRAPGGRGSGPGSACERLTELGKGVRRRAGTGTRGSRLAWSVRAARAVHLLPASPSRPRSARRQAQGPVPAPHEPGEVHRVRWAQRIAARRRAALRGILPRLVPGVCGADVRSARSPRRRSPRLSSRRGTRQACLGACVGFGHGCRVCRHRQRLLRLRLCVMNPNSQTP